MTDEKLRILIIEDHDDSAKCLAILLRNAGYGVEISHDGREARRAAYDHHFDVALCDIGLPDIDGCDLFAQLSSIQPMHGIALTGFSISDDFARYRAAGFATRLVKPLDFEDVLAAIHEVISETWDCSNEAIY